MIKIMAGIQKGGVGKSTSASVISEILAASGFKVLTIDLDSQGNTTQMLTQRNIYDFSGSTIFEALKELNPNPYIVNVKENLDLLPAEDMLSTFSRYIYTSKVHSPAKVLDETVNALEKEYDFVIMDCPPNLGDIVINAISCADYIIVPVQLEPFSMDALDRFLAIVNEAKEEGYTTAKLLGIAFTMVDRRNAIGKSIGNAIREKYGSTVFNTEIRMRAKLKEFTLVGTQMSKKAEVDALQDYINLTEEMIQRVKETQRN